MSPLFFSGRLAHSFEGSYVYYPFLCVNLKATGVWPIDHYGVATEKRDAYFFEMQLALQNYKLPPLPACAIYCILVCLV